MAGSRDRKKKSDEPAGAPGWMVTYGDMMSLLLCFFVLLLSFSTISEKKYSQAIQSLKGALGVLPRNLTTVEVLPAPRTGRPVARSIEQLARRLQHRLQVTGRAQDINIDIGKQGELRINLPSRILFDSAKSELKPDAVPVLDDLADIIKDLPGAFIEVYGHTDSRPLTPGAFYRDNYDLSYGRAKTVTFHLSDRGGIPRERFEMVACGPSQPVATNETEEGQQANRRVELRVRGDLSEETLEGIEERVRSIEGGAVETRTPTGE